MPPTRPRPGADDANSEVSSILGSQKDKAVLKSKKAAVNSSGAASTTMKIATVNGALAATSAANATASREPEFPHTEWLTLPVDFLHRYRSTYRLNTPNAYTHPHADFLYNSSRLAQRAPSQVLARRKMRDLKAYRKKTAEQTSQAQMNGISKSRPSRIKDGASNQSSRDHSSDGRRKAQQKEDNTKDSDMQEPSNSAEDPSTTNIIPSIEQDGNSSTTTADQSGTASASNQADTDMTSQTDPDPYTVPSTLNQQDPESTIIGSQHPHNLANTVRKHFNAQHLNEPETIARFTYVVRQQGCSTHSRVFPIAQKPLHSAVPSAREPELDRSVVLLMRAKGLDPDKPTHGSLLTSSTSHLGGGQVQVEGGLGDGNGWIIGSMGREIKLGDAGGGGGGTFRLRFQP